jgi:DNA-directed RNA polymerase subunit F
MLVKRIIAVKVIVTSEFKNGLHARLNAALKKVEQTLQDLERRGGDYLSEIESKDSSRADEFRGKLRVQVQRQKEMQARLLAELADVNDLRIGDEYSQGTIDGFAEVAVGDNLEAKLRPAELVVKDGTVVRIEGE